MSDIIDYFMDPIFSQATVEDDVEPKMSYRYTAVKCPVQYHLLTDGQRFLTPSNLMAHLFDEHDADERFREAFRGKRLLMEFDEYVFKMDRNTLFGFLAYAGTEGDSSTLPGIMGLSCKNKFYPTQNDLLKWEFHMPIFILGYKMTYHSYYGGNRIILGGDPEKGEECIDISNDEVFMVWLVVPYTHQNIRATISVLNHDQTKSRSVSLMCRCLTETQDPRKFLNQKEKHITYFRLSRNEYDGIVNKGEPAILEIVIYGGDY